MEFRHEFVMPSEHLPFRMFIFEGRDGNYKVNKHWHRSLELFLVQEGNITFYINNQEIQLYPGDFVIVNSNEIHSIDAPNPNTTIVVQIPMEAFEGYIEPDTFVIFAKQNTEINKQIYDIIVTMYHYYEEKVYGYRLKVKSLFLELLHLLLTKCKEDGENQKVVRVKKQLDRLSCVTQYMREHYREDITLISVAQHFGFTPTYLSRIFHTYANVNYRTYLLDIRVQNAMREMMNTEHSLSVIAMEHGFPDCRSFTSAFHKRYGCTPSAYRKQKK